ncbi:MAG: helix-turn-helix transcriptional regulator [Chloroflexia bacterium]|jgi:DNA-binding transcriptional ArsR family regulator|nr:helix-turn-helix transcriptional regulator [Chloroflexia bacterium]
MKPGNVNPPRGIALDAAALKAFAHPLRVRLWEALEEKGPATATQLAILIGESSGSTSYHLRQLSRFGLIEELPKRGNAKERWWRANPGGFSFNGDVFRRDPNTAAAAEMLLAQVVQQRVEETLRWLQESRTTPHEWVQASIDSRTKLMLTRPELEELTSDVTTVLQQYRAVSAARQSDTDEMRNRSVSSNDETVSEDVVRIHVHFNAFPVGLGEPEEDSRTAED